MLFQICVDVLFPKNKNGEILQDVQAVLFHTVNIADIDHAAKYKTKGVHTVSLLNPYRPTSKLNSLKCKTMGLVH